MNDEKLRFQLGANIASYRKHFGLTQAGLAEKLNYSDKAVSKWERGESMPDVQTLVQLAELFEVTVNDLLVDPNALPENPGKIGRVMENAVEKRLKRKADKSIILKLCSVLTWFVALLVFVVLSSLDVPKSWVAFVYAIPVNAIVELSMRSAWHDFRRNKLLISTIAWGTLLSLFVSLWVFNNVQVWRIFLLGIPGQIAIFLWFRMFRKTSREVTDE
ncbi:MAG: helix-turn-helix transcriptional regulator [Oscillospiraceae bacterium]|nr:helix-turn-helix transcriptional regulator [Oscillospiraceae bacterium]